MAKPARFARGNELTRRKLLRLRQAAQRDKAPRVALRLQAILISLDRLTNLDIARLLRVDRTRVHAWVRAWNDCQEQGVLEGHRSGRPPALSPEQRERLLDIVESGPVAYGLNTGVRTSPILADVIGEEFGVSYHPGHVRKLLHAVGCSVQRPTTKLVQADHLRIKAFYGTSENAVKTQIWIAVCVYNLLGIVKKEFK